jgi:predicted RNA-binding Zn-ribbon protein involved in translation (DUF1610 family)
VPKQFECKSCGAHLEYDASEKAMKCPYCDSVEIIEIKDEKPPEEKDFFATPRNTGWDAPVKTVKCENCGATITAIERSGECAFCNSPYVKEISPNKNIIRPENIVPFQVDKRTATGLFRDWLGKGFFRPSNLTKLSRLELLKGVYVPFWTYDCNAYSTWNAQSGYYYYVSEHYTAYENGRSVQRTRQVRKTRWRPSSGRRHDSYNDELVVASKGLDYELVLKIYPFQLGALIPYKPEFLSGWNAEDYSINLQEGWAVAKNRVLSSQQSRCASDVPGDTHRFLHVNTSVSDITYKHILLPIWVASYDYKKKRYQFLINGQTGEVQGYAPISWWKVAGVASVIAGIVGAIVYFLYFF